MLVDGGRCEEEYGVESSTSPVGMEVDSSVRVLAWGC